MYNNGLFASPEEILSDGQKMVSFADELLSELNSFDANEKSLMDIWHGDASNSFSVVYEEEMATLKKFQSMLNEKGIALQNASGILSDTEAQNASNASKLGS